MESVVFLSCGKLLNNQTSLKCVKITTRSKDILTILNTTSRIKNLYCGPNSETGKEEQELDSQGHVHFFTCACL